MSTILGNNIRDQVDELEARLKHSQAEVDRLTKAKPARRSIFIRHDGSVEVLCEKFPDQPYVRRSYPQSYRITQTAGYGDHDRRPSSVERDFRSVGAVDGADVWLEV